MVGRVSTYQAELPVFLGKLNALGGAALEVGAGSLLLASVMQPSGVLKNLAAWWDQLPKEVKIGIGVGAGLTVLAGTAACTVNVPDLIKFFTGRQVAQATQTPEAQIAVTLLPT